MKTLQQEAEDYAKDMDLSFYDTVEEIPVKEYSKKDFIAGVNSNYVKRQIIQAQLELLKNFYYGEDLKDDEILDFYKRVKEDCKKQLEKELKQLENE